MEKIIEFVRDAAAKQGFSVGPADLDPRIDLDEFRPVRAVVEGASIFSVSDSERNGRVAIWQASNADTVLDVTSTFSAHLDRIEDAGARFYVYGDIYLMLDQVKGWRSAADIDIFLAQLVPS